METQKIIVDGQEYELTIKGDESEISEIFLDDIENSKINLEDTHEIPVDEIIEIIKEEENGEIDNG